jgi:hypothetical protein
MLAIIQQAQIECHWCRSHLTKRMGVHRWIRLVSKQSAVVHNYNPSYSGCKDWEDHGSRPTPAKG